MKRHAPVALVLACVAVVAGTFYLLLSDRLESGDIYPPGSSLRSDPMGTMVLFESLRRVPGISVERDHSATGRMPQGSGTTYLHFDASPQDWTTLPRETFQTIDRFLLEGGRLVITLSPDKSGDIGPARDDDGKGKPSAEPKKKTPVGSPRRGDEVVSLADRWDLKLRAVPRKTPRKAPARNVSGLPLPSELPWNGDLSIEKPDTSWRVIYEGESGPVLAERRRGSGSIVIATDSFFVSNEALVRQPHPDLLAWLVGGSTRVVFDEAHLGIVENPGIATLARKYRLHGGALALLALAALFIWKNSTPLAPRRRRPAPDDEAMPGRPAGAGFVNLLRRNIPREQVFDVCIQEWRKSFAHGTGVLESERRAVDEIVRNEQQRAPSDRDPVSAWRKIASALHRRTSKPHI